MGLVYAWKEVKMDKYDVLLYDVNREKEVNHEKGE